MISRRLLHALLLPLLANACAPLPAERTTLPALAIPATQHTLTALTAPTAQPVPVHLPSWGESLQHPELDALIHTALRQQPDMTAARARLAAAERAGRLAELATGLQYRAEADITRQRLSDHGLFPTALIGKNYTQANLSLALSLDLDLWGRQRALLAATRSEQQATQEDLAYVRLSLASAVADSYLAWKGALHLHNQMRALRDIHRQLLARLERRQQLGLDAAAPLAEARRRLSQDDEALHQQDYLVQSWRYRLAALLGSDPDHAADLAEPPAEPAGRTPGLLPLPATLPLDWLAQRPDIAALKARIEAASARSEAARAAFYPDLDIKLLVGLDSLELTKLLDSTSVAGGAGAALRLPFFNQRTLQARLGLQEAEHVAAIATYNHAILEAARQAADACALEDSITRRQQAHEHTLAETATLQTLARQRQQLGLANPLETLLAEAATLSQRMTASELQTARLRARAALLRALGRPPVKDTP